MVAPIISTKGGRYTALEAIRMVVDDGHRRITSIKAELERRFGIDVTRQRVHQIVRKNKLKVSHRRRAVKRFCIDCRARLRGKVKRCHACHLRLVKAQVRFVDLTCDQCGDPFKIRLGDYHGRVNNKRGNGKGKLWFCSKRCSGAYSGIHYGVAANVATHKALRARKKIFRARVARAKAALRANPKTSVTELAKATRIPVNTIKGWQHRGLIPRLARKPYRRLA